MTPLDIEDGDADRWLPYLENMSIEAEVKSLTYDLGPDDRLYLDDTDAEEEPSASS